TGTDSIKGGGGNQTFATQVARGQHIKIGDIAMDDVTVSVLPPGGIIQETDGVIGLELFSRYVVQVDVDKKELTLFDKETYQPPSDASVVPIRLVQNRMPFVDARVTIDGGKPVPIDVALDIGAGHAMWLNR